VKRRKKYLLIDGYNIINSWPKLIKAAESISLSAALDKLIEIMENYVGASSEHVIIVFDAYMVSEGQGSISERGALTVVYTKEAETADAYIERTASKLARHNRVRVATSDGLEQVIILGQGAYRMSPGDLMEEISLLEARVRERIEKSRPLKNNELIGNLDDETQKMLEQMRLRRE